MVLRMVAQGLLAGAAGARCGLVTGKAECGLGAGEDPPGTGGSADPLRTVCSAAWISEEKTLGQLRGTIWKLRWRDRPLGGIASNSPGRKKGPSGASRSASPEVAGGVFLTWPTGWLGAGLWSRECLRSVEARLAGAAGPGRAEWPSQD